MKAPALSDHVGALRGLLAALSAGEFVIPRGEVPALAVDLARAQVRLLAPVLEEGVPRHSPAPPDRLLGAKEASQRTGMSTRWLYLHADELPFAHRTSGRAIRFSERGIERWKALKRPQA